MEHYRVFLIELLEFSVCIKNLSRQDLSFDTSGRKEGSSHRKISPRLWTQFFEEDAIAFYRLPVPCRTGVGSAGIGSTGVGSTTDEIVSEEKSLRSEEFFTVLHE